MKKDLILSTLILSIFITGCSFSQPSTSSLDKNLELKKDRDYLATISRTNELHIIDGKTDTLYKTCKLKVIICQGE